MPALADNTIIANDQGFVSVKVGQGQVRFRVQERSDGSLLLTPEPVAPAAAAQSAAPSQPATAPAPATSPVRDAAAGIKPPGIPSAPSSAADGWLQLNREAMQLLRGRSTTRV